VFMGRGHAARTEQDRRHDFNAAVRNFAFVQRTASRQFPMMPEVNLRKGMSLRLLGQDTDAAREFLDAIRLKSDYTPAYAALFDVYRDLGDLDAARGILETGLANAPDSRMLAEKKAELDRDTSVKK
jgi:tetratricopeptide (TPR) repeat protein